MKKLFTIMGAIVTDGLALLAPNKSLAIISALIFGGATIALFTLFPEQADAARIRGFTLN
jgi:hypothetical protein